MPDGPFMLPDGRPLDDAEPRDIARALAPVFERLAEEIGAGGPNEESRPALVESLAQAGALMRAWAEFGRWQPRRLDRAEKIATRLTDAHLAAVERAIPWLPGSPDDEETRLREVPAILRELRSALTGPAAPGARGA